jgi:hypothetical protein
MFSAEINTSAAGFQASPFYVARLMGPRVFEGPPVFEGPTQLFMADALINPIIDPPTSLRKFTVQLFPFSSPSATAAAAGVPARTILGQWQVAWMGIES